MAKVQHAVCETVGELREFLAGLPEELAIDQEQTLARVRKVTYLGSGGYEAIEFALM